MTRPNPLPDGQKPVTAGQRSGRRVGRVPVVTGPTESDPLTKRAVRIEVPVQPPVLGPVAARALLRLLARAAKRRDDGAQKGARTRENEC
jgi:hypothetical protein